MAFGGRSMKTSTNPSTIIRAEMLVLFGGLIAWLLVTLLIVPYASTLFEKGMDLYGFWNVEKSISSRTQEKKQLQHDVQVLDSLATSAVTRRKVDEGSITSMLYDRAIAAGTQGTKIALGEKKSLGASLELPLTVRGVGSYQAIGRLVASLEDIPAPLCVRQAAIAKTTSGAIEIVVDCVIELETTAGKRP